MTGGRGGCTVDTNGVQPLFRVVAGNPDHEEVAALVSVLTALCHRHGAERPARDRPRPRWSRPDRHAAAGGPRGWSNR
ncbi:acyl-CoA carboxylase subunit epsilon [Actinokineospora sp. PR83]|uniref:acyl-CoA carboxylase subunit epsilon n=1 Tax=Actinokineospora sp. PR83 TaxID=2884908 RepID=UPI0035AB9597